MKMKTLLILGGVMTAISSPASAHTGDHSAPLVANIVHWISSPNHALFSVIGVAVVALVITAARKRRS